MSGDLVRCRSRGALAAVRPRRPADCDCRAGVGRLEVGGVADLGTFLLVLGAVWSVFGAGFEVNDLTLELFLAAGASKGGGVLATLALYGVRDRGERNDARRRPREECSSTEHASTANRVARAARSARDELVGAGSPPDASDEPIPTVHGGLTRAKGDLVVTLGTLSSRAEYADALPAGDVADLLALLESHLPESVRLFTSLPRTGRYSRAEGSAASVLRGQLEGFLGEVGAVNEALRDAERSERRRIRDAEAEERRAGEHALAEHGRFLEERRAAREPRTLPAAAPEAAPDPLSRPLDPTDYETPTPPPRRRTP